MSFNPSADQVSNVEFMPEPETRVAGNATRIGQTTFEGGSFKLQRAISFNRILIRLTAFTAPGTIRFLLFQAKNGVGANATPAPRVATVSGFAPGGTGNMLMTPAEGVVAMSAGIYYVLWGRDSAAGTFTMRTYTVQTLDLSNANVDALTHVTNYSTAILANTLPATFDPRPVATGQATPQITDLTPVHRLIKV